MVDAEAEVEVAGAGVNSELEVRERAKRDDVDGATGPPAGAVIDEVDEAPGRGDGEIGLSAQSITTRKETQTHQRST